MEPTKSTGKVNVVADVLIFIENKILHIFENKENYGKTKSKDTESKVIW